jgi:hypothetical protein
MVLYQMEISSLLLTGLTLGLPKIEIIQMKKLILIVGICLPMSCAYDNVEDLYGSEDCPPGSISYSATIAPIISSNCAVSGCHANGQQIPTLESYNQISMNSGRIKTRTSNGTMPPPGSGMSLTVEEIEAIACWVDSGAPEN